MFTSTNNRNHWFTNLDQVISVDIAYTDISKTFDTVSHKKLQDVLKSYGILNVLNWMQTFICYRKQCVSVNNVLPSYLPISSGVLQGSVLGPILLIVYVNNLIKFCHPQHSNSGIYLYASGFQPFLYGGTLFSYSNFCDTPIILVNNKKVFTENLSMISQFSSQNHDDL